MKFRIVLCPIMRAAPCSRRFNDRSTRHGTAIAANELFVGDSAQDDPQPPLSQSDLVLWHNATVRCDAPIWSLLEVKLTCRERRKRVDLMKLTHLRHWLCAAAMVLMPGLSLSKYAFEPIQYCP